MGILRMHTAKIAVPRAQDSGITGRRDFDFHLRLARANLARIIHENLGKCPIEQPFTQRSRSFFRVGPVDRRITKGTENRSNRSVISVRELCGLCEKLFARLLFHE